MNNTIYPFKFLDSYTAEDKDIFFGRDEEVDQLYQMIYQSDILLLYGASGTGKTSLIQCGLASKFQKHDWLEVFVRRHKNLNESLQKSLITIGGQNKASSGSSENLDWLNDIMEEDQETSVFTKTLSQTQVYLKNIYLKHFRPIYLIFDQFEELFILGSKAEQAEFIATVQEILKVEQPVKLIFSIREEYLGSLYEFERAVPELFRKKLRIDPMNLEKAKDVVLGATGSKKSIVHINPEEAEEIAEQVFEKIRGEEKTLTIQLPYLQVFLDKFYRHISKDKSKNPTTEATFSLAALSEIGDIGDILRDFLDEQIVEISKAQKCTGKTIWKILSPFVTIDGTKEPTGINSLTQNFPEIQKDLIEQVVTALMNNRILRYIEEEELYEIAHDSLALRIAEKRSDDDVALLEVRNLIKSQSLLKDEARELFSEKQLDFISPFLKRLHLKPEESKLIEESREEVIRAQKEALRKKRGTQIAVSLFVLVLLILLGFALVKMSEAEKAKTKAEEEKDKNEKIIKAMDFYGDKYALAFKNDKYGFIDKDGNEHPNIDFIYDKGEPFDLETGFAEMEIGLEESIKYLLDTSGNKYRLIYVAEILKNRSNVESTLSKEDIKWLRRNIRKNKKLLNKLEQISDGIELEIKELISILNQDEEKLALDFSGLTNVDILNVLDNIVKESNIKDRIEVLFLKGTDLSIIPDNLAKFKNLKQLDISGTRVTNLPLSFFKLVNLTGLNLGYTQIKELPKGIGSLEKLEILDLSRTQIKELPKSIGSLEKLEDLDLSETQIKELPKSIEKLENLESLNLGYTQIKEFPKSIGSLVNLKSLVLSSLEIKELPESIGSLEKLEYLALSYTQIKELPKSIGELDRLEDLDLSETQIKELPESIGSLKKLKYLALSYTQIKELPKSIGSLEKLEYLALSETQIKELPKSIEKLEKLEYLALSETQIKELPKSIGSLEKLEILNLSQTQIKALPESIGSLVNLKSLYLWKTQIKELPKSIEKLEKLEGLNLSYTQIKKIPESIWKLDRLKNLGLSGTQIKALPESIGSLEKLEDLDLSGTQIKELPESIGSLVNLKYLYLSNLEIKELSESIEKLDRLEYLNLSETQIKELPKSIDNLKNLKELYLSETRIKELPESIGNLKNLKILDLSETRIKELPESIGNLKNLKELFLSGTMIKELPKSIGNFKKLEFLEYTLDENDTSIKSKLEALQNELPDCFFNITDKEGNPIEL